MLQPRRVAARAAATRIAEERDWTVGREVGYHVRFDRKISPQTRLRVLTEGILTRKLVDDPFLDGIGAVLLDEFHERSLHTDVCIALLREVQQTVRPDLKLVVMSATLDADPVARFLGNCPILNVPGRTFPVDISYRSGTADFLETQVARAIEETPDDGDVLVFLPGVAEIQRSMDSLRGFADRERAILLPLHGSLPVDEQVRTLKPMNQRKIVLATNIAETSLTIDGVTTVIDSGLARVASFDPARGMDRLDLQRISQASARQRAGRAGRTRPGRCIRLWTEKEQHQLEEFDQPELTRVDLCSTVLSLHAWGKADVLGFGWFEQPSAAGVQSAESLLTMLGALADGKITSLGSDMLRLPVHPRLSRLMIQAVRMNVASIGAAIAALLSEKDIVARSPVGESRAVGSARFHASSDVLLRLEWMDKPHEGIDPAAVSAVKRTRDELLRNAGHRKADRHPSDDELLKLILLAYPDRVCKRRSNDPSTAAIAGGGGVRLAAESCVRTGELFVAVDVRHDPRSVKAEALVRIASRIEEDWLREFFPQAVRQVRELIFDQTRQAVIARRTVSYHDLVLIEDADGAVDRAGSGPVLYQATRHRARETVLADEAVTQLVARLALMQDQLPQHPWPTFNQQLYEELLEEACSGRKAVEELRPAMFVEALKSRLVYPLDRLLEQHAPASIEVPTGNRIQVEYSLTRPPTLAVRLQELFGWTEGPKIAGGRVAVVLHLLGPNYRPVQITDDLANFWKLTYFAVRKDLKARYPKHSWPENPLTATPEAKGKRRRE